MIQKPADTEQTIATILAERWSGRAYDPDIEVKEEDIIALTEAARWAPSCSGEEPWRYLLCNKFTDKAAWDKAYDSLVPANQTWAKNAPLLILATSVTEFREKAKTNPWAGHDTGAATLSLCLQATSLGLMSHQMGGYDVEKMRVAFNIPDNIRLWSMIAIGHPAPLDSLSQEQMERELKPRQRRPLNQQFFHGKWPLTQ